MTTGLKDPAKAGHAPKMPDLTKSLACQDRAMRSIPGMVQLLSKRPDMYSLGVWPGYYSKARGAEVWDLDGNRYLDMSIAGIGANVLGYADPAVNAAVIAAVKDGSSCSLNCPEEVELAEALCRLHPWAEQVRFARCGGEAMSVAIRIARAHTGRDKVVICGYHGWHDWYLAANVGTENALGTHLIPGLSPTGVPKALKGTTLTFTYNDLASLQAVLASHPGEIAAVVMEPIRNIQPAEGFLAGVKTLAHHAGAVFVFDEVSAGFRMNAGGAHLLFKVDPDIAVFSKALGNGYPIAAVIGRRAVMASTQQTFISSTMWTERVGPAAALAVLRRYAKEDVGAHLMRIGKAVQDGWAASARKAGLEIAVGGIYPLSHFDFQGPEVPAMKALFVQRMLERGFLASTIFYAMRAHTDAHVRRYLKAVDAVFKDIRALAASGGLRAALKGQPAASGFKRIT